MNALAWFNVAILVYFLVANTFYAILLAGAAWELTRHLLVARTQSRRRLLRAETAPGVSLIAPAHNEASTIAESVRAMLGLYYPNLEVVVVNDGSTDATRDVLVERFDLVEMAPVFRQSVDTQPVTALYRSSTYPRLVLVDKENGGKADALNAGLNVASGTLICAADADTVIEPDAIGRLVWPFVAGRRTIAAGGTIRVANGSEISHGRVVRVGVPHRPLAGFQVVEYLRAFLFGRLGWNNLGGNLIVSGAFGLFDRQSMVDNGGYAPDTVGEDMELAVRLRRRSYEARSPGLVAFVPDPVAWTEAPQTMRVLGRQRDRWHRGLADIMWRNRRLLFNPRYGTLGLLGYPYFLFVELLGPVIEAVGLVTLVVALALGAVDYSFALLFFLVAYGYGLCLALFALALEEFGFHRSDSIADRLRILLWALLEPLGYRQATVIWRLQGLVKYLRGRTDWGVMSRAGFGETAVDSADEKGQRP